MKSKLNTLLLTLTLLDLSLATIALFFPEFWIATIHGIPIGDPMGLVRRLGAGWAAFFLFQAIALFRWRKHSHWLVLVAGIRLTELFADWVYLYFAFQVTTVGKIGLALSPVVNVLAAWYLLRSFHALNSKIEAPLTGSATSVH